MSLRELIEWLRSEVDAVRPYDRARLPINCDRSEISRFVEGREDTCPQFGREIRIPCRAIAEQQAEHAVIFSEEPMSTTHGAALVSGASRGLGAVIARRLAADGWPVAVNYRSELERDEAGHVVEDILARGGTAEAFAADITDEAAAAGLVSRATDQLGSIDVLVVNATGRSRSCRSRS